MLASIVPCDSPINLTALRAVYKAGKRVLTAVRPFLPVSSAVKVGSSNLLVQYIGLKLLVHIYLKRTFQFSISFIF